MAISTYDQSSKYYIPEKQLAKIRKVMINGDVMSLTFV